MSLSELKPGDTVFLLYRETRFSKQKIEEATIEKIGKKYGYIVGHGTN